MAFISDGSVHLSLISLFCIIISNEKWKFLVCRRRLRACIPVECYRFQKCIFMRWWLCMVLCNWERLIDNSRRPEWNVLMRICINLCVSGRVNNEKKKPEKKREENVIRDVKCDTLFLFCTLHEISKPKTCFFDLNCGEFLWPNLKKSICVYRLSVALRDMPWQRHTCDTFYV